MIKTNENIKDNYFEILINGNFDFNLNKEFRSIIDLFLKSKCTVCKINFQTVSYIDSSALGMLLLSKEKADASNKKIHLINLRDTNKKIIEIASFEKIFKIN